MKNLSFTLALLILLCTPKGFCSAPTYDFLMRHYLDRKAPVEKEEKLTIQIGETITDIEQDKFTDAQLQILLKRRALETFEVRQRKLKREISKLSREEIKNLEANLGNEKRYQRVLKQSLPPRKKIQAALDLDVENLIEESQEQIQQLDRKDLLNTLQMMRAGLEKD